MKLSISNNSGLQVLPLLMKLYQIFLLAVANEGKFNKFVGKNFIYHCLLLHNLLCLLQQFQ